MSDSIRVNNSVNNSLLIYRKNLRNKTSRTRITVYELNMVELVKKLVGFDGTLRFTVVFTKAFPVLD